MNLERWWNQNCNNRLVHAAKDNLWPIGMQGKTWEQLDPQYHLVVKQLYDSLPCRGVRGFSE